MKSWAEAEFKEVAKGGTGQFHGGDLIDLSFLEGKRVVKTGYLDQSKLRFEKRTEGGFAIDYQEGSKIRRVVLGFNDLGFWIEWKGELGKASEEDLLKEKVCEVWDEMCSQKVTIVDDPLERRYLFVGDNGKRLLVLDVFDLKRTCQRVWRHFAPTGERNVDDVITDLGMWAYN